MRGAVEAVAFIGLAVALHAGAFALIGGDGGARSAGDGGQARATIETAPAELAATAARWREAPQAAEAPDAAAPPPVPEAPRVPADLPGPAAESTPQAPRAQTAQSAPQPPEPPEPQRPDVTAEAADADSPRPRARADAEPSAPAAEPRSEEPPAEAPAPAPETPAPSAGADQQAAGQGGGGAAGTDGADDAALSQEERRTLLAAWGGKIRAAIERHKRYPDGTRGSGTATVHVEVTRSGALSDVALAASAGDPALDAAALAAVRSAAPFPAAPDALDRDTMRFEQPVRFSP